jgi:hypothetical protein
MAREHVAAGEPIGGGVDVALSPARIVVEGIDPRPILHFRFATT